MPKLKNAQGCLPHVGFDVQQHIRSALWIPFAIIPSSILAKRKSDVNTSAPPNTEASQNCVMLRVLPSGSLNHATWAPLGDFQMPASSGFIPA